MPKPINPELEELIARVKASSKSVRETLDDYFKETVWSLLKDEWASHMTERDKRKLIKKLEIIKHCSQQERR